MEYGDRSSGAHKEDGFEIFQIEIDATTTLACYVENLISGSESLNGLSDYS